MRITNGYGNDTRPYRLYQYTGATRVMKNGVQCFAISISPDLVIESRDYMESSICHYSGLPSTSRGNSIDKQCCSDNNLSSKSKHFEVDNVA